MRLLIEVADLPRIQDRHESVIRAAGGHEIHLKTTQAEHFPGQINDVAQPDVFENIDRLHRRGHAEKKLVVRSGILALEERRRAKQIQAWGRLEGATLYLYTFHETF